MYNFDSLNIFVWFSFFGPDYLVMIYNLHVVRFLFKVLKIFFVILLISSFLTPIKDDLKLTSFIDNVVAYIPFIIVPLNLIEIIESWMNSETINSTMHNFEECFKSLNTSRDMKTVHLNFIRGFRKKCILCTVLFVAEFIVRVSRPTGMISTYSNIILSIAVLYKHFAMIHIVLCVDLNSMILSSLSDKLRFSSTDSDTEFSLKSTFNPEIIALFQCTTNIFQRVSCISGNINERFGWFLSSVFVNTIMNLIRIAISAFMWIWTDTFEFLRKSIHVSFLFKRHGQRIVVNLTNVQICLILRK